MKFFLFDYSGGAFPEALFVDFGVCVPAICNNDIIDILMRVLASFLGLEPTALFAENKEQFCRTSETPPLSVMDIGALYVFLIFTH